MKNDLSFAEKMDKKTEFQHLLYRRGYLVTTNENICLNKYPFYGNWYTKRINSKFVAIVHKDQHLFIQKSTDCSTTIILIGHAYNPFTLDADEQHIIQVALSKFRESSDRFFDYISELTGIHVIGLFNGNDVIFVQDCTAMEACYYGECNGNIYFLSHTALLGDVDQPSSNSFVKRLIASYPYNHWGTKYLPGDVTVYNELSRLGPNVYVEYAVNSFNIKRFFPCSAHPELSPNDTYTIEAIAKTIHASVDLCAKKWKRPAISLSGGIDSRTTLASANGIYDKFYYYSFHCKEQEHRDAIAASEICKKLSLPHKTYAITNNSKDISDFELFKELVSHNEAYTHTPPDHEIRKYYFLAFLSDFDVELKSWASEIGRAYWERRYGYSLPKKLHPRDFSIFQTRYLGTPILLRQSDKAYKTYLENSNLSIPLFNYEHTDLFYWEYRFGSNGTRVTMEQQIFNFDVTMPMNNRKLMDMFLWYPHEFRKNDGVNKAVICFNEPRFSEIQNDVHNDYFSGRRVKLEGLFYRFRYFL